MTNISMLDVRNFILVAAALVAVYLVLSLVRLLRKGSRPGQEATSRAFPATPAAAPDQFATGRTDPERHGRDLLLEPTAGPSPVPGGGQEGAAPPDFSRELARTVVEAEVQDLRREVDRLRAGLAELAEELQQLKVTRNVSPLYSEAMVLARQGVTTAGIADRCGISVGEAELVVALARGKSGFDFRDEGDERDERDTAVGN